jgi:hypothetical protein
LEKVSLDPSKTFEKLFAKFLAVLFCMSGTVCHVGPRPHMIDA